MPFAPWRFPAAFDVRFAAFLAIAGFRGASIDFIDSVTRIDLSGVTTPSGDMAGARMPPETGPTNGGVSP